MVGVSEECTAHEPDRSNLRRFRWGPGSGAMGPTPLPFGLNPEPERVGVEVERSDHKANVVGFERNKSTRAFGRQQYAVSDDSALDESKSTRRMSSNHATTTVSVVQSQNADKNRDVAS